jgi:hypothetical protein
VGRLSRWGAEVWNRSSLFRFIEELFSTSEHVAKGANIYTESQENRRCAWYWQVERMG